MEKYTAPVMEVEKFEEDAAIMMFGPVLPGHGETGNASASSGACE